MNSLDLVPISDDEWRQKTISELFHLISQPLTGLHCLLEVSLMKKQTAAGYRRDIQTAIEATSRLADSLRRAREMAEADSAGDPHRLEISALLRQVVSEFAPLMEATHITPEFKLVNALVQADEGKLQRAIFYLLDDILRDLPLGSQLMIAMECNEKIELRLGGNLPRSAMEAIQLPTLDSPTVSVAYRSLRAIGGRVFRGESAAGRCYLIELPLLDS